MLNQLLKFTLVSSALLWLRPRWRGLLVLACAVLLIHVLHSEYLEYVLLSSNDTNLVLSYGIKWAALLVVATTYVAFLLSGASPSHRRRNEAAAPPEKRRVDTAPADDGFDFLRNKKRLQSRAEKVIAAKPGRIRKR